jgi:hypothetical protein
MRTILLSTFTLLLALTLSGCGKKPATDPAPGPVADQQKPGAPGQFPLPNPGGQQEPPRPANIAGIPDRETVKNDLRQLALLVQANDTRRSPRDLKAFIQSLQRDARHLAQALEKQQYGLFPNVPLNSNTVLAFEWPGDSAGQHIVVMGDGSVTSISRQQLEALFKK